MDANTEIAPTALAEPAAAPEPPALLATGLGKRYGSVVALDGVSLSVAPGELVGLVGANGAGKSTLVKISCGLVRPTTGTVTICGAPAGKSRCATEARLPRRAVPLSRAGPRPRRSSPFTSGLRDHQGGETERDELLELVGLSDVARRRVEGMSKGMQQRLGIAQALVGEPKLLLLDEPTSALDPAGRRAIRALLLELRDRGIAVLINSHLLGELERVCDRVAILAHGKVVADGRPDELTHVRGRGDPDRGRAAALPERE